MTHLSFLDARLEERDIFMIQVPSIPIAIRSRLPRTREQVDQQRVRISIWSSFATGGFMVGHIAIETPMRTIFWQGRRQKIGYYMSFWPAQDFPVYKAVVKPAPPHFSPSYEKDMEYEGRAAENSYCLYTLDYEAMENEFVILRDRVTSWALHGNIFCVDWHSCASLAYRLLLKGGLDYLIPSKERTKLGLGNGAVGSTVAVVGTANATMQHAAGNFAAADLGDSVKVAFYSSEMMGGPLLPSPDFLRAVLMKAQALEGQWCPYLT
jgi:hypothetical protein